MRQRQGWLATIFTEPEVNNCFSNCSGAFEFINSLINESIAICTFCYNHGDYLYQDKQWFVAGLFDSISKKLKPFFWNAG